MNVFGIGQNVSVDQIAAIQRQQQNNTQTPSSQSQGDRVSISSEAMEMYRASQASSSQAPATQSATVQLLPDEQSENSSGGIVAQVTAWYDTFRENMGNVEEPDFSTWPPENLARREELIKERDALAPQTSNKEYTDTNRKMNGILDEIMLLDAVGHEQVLSDADVKAGLDALHASMDKWAGDEPGTAAYDAGEGEWVEPSIQYEAAELKTNQTLDEAFFQVFNRRAENLQDEVLDEMMSKQS